MKIETKKICANWWAERFEIDEKREDFKKALFSKIDDGMFLRVDYDPNQPLLEVLEEIGVECKGRMFSARGILPGKTWMEIDTEESIVIVRIKEGYGMPVEVLIDES